MVSGLARRLVKRDDRARWFFLGVVPGEMRRQLGQQCGLLLLVQPVRWRPVERLPRLRLPPRQNPVELGRGLVGAAFRGRKVGRGVPPSRCQGTRIAAAWKAAFPVSAYARSLNWENGRLARSMDGPCAAPATDETSVVPVSLPPAAKMADFPLVPPRWRRWERLVAEKSRNGPAVCTKRACPWYPVGLPLVPCGPATCPRWACHWYPVGLPFAPNGRPISEFSGYGLAASRQRVQGRTAEILKIFRNPRQLQNIWQSGRRWNAVPNAFRGRKVGRGVPPLGTKH